MKSTAHLKAAAWVGAFAVALGGQAALAENLVYVPMGDLNKVLIVDTATDEVTGKIDGVPVVHGLAQTPDGKFLIAGSLKQRKAGGAMDKTPAAGMPKKKHDKAAKADGKMAVPMVSNVSVISVADGKVVRKIEVPGAVHHVAVGPKGRYAVVTHPKLASITAIDLATYKVLATIPTGAMPNYAVFTADGNSVYVSNAGNDTISKVDTTKWTVDWSAKVGGKPEHIALSADGATLYVANVKSGDVTVLSAKEPKVVNTFKIGKKLHGIALSDDGKTLFVAARGQGKLVRFDLASGKMSSTVLAPQPYHLAAPKGTGKLYISSAGKPKLWVVDQKTNEILKEIPIGGRGHQMAFNVGG